MIRWLDTLDEYGRIGLRSESEPVPLLAPSDEDCRRRWDEVLRDLYVPAPGPRAAGGVVVACGEELVPLARCLAARSDSRVAVCSSLQAAGSTVAAAPEPRAVVVSLASQLKMQMVGELVSGARRAGKQLGFLSGRTLAGLSFSIAKTLLSPRPSLSGVDVFDAVSHQLDHSAPSDELADRLRRPCLAKVIRSHGEGSHAKLPGLTVCGLLDPIEFPDAPSRGCSWLERRCKRSPAEATDVVFGHELRAPVVFFVCCNGFNFAKELYPSPVSMSLSLVEACPAAVIAPIRPLIAPDVIFEAIRPQLCGGAPLGEIVDALNAISEDMGQPNTFALHGDPQLRILPRAVEGEDHADRQRRPRTAERRSAGDHDVESWLVRLLRRAERGRRLVRSINAWLDEDQRGVTEPAATLLTKVERLAIYGLKRAQAQRRAASSVESARGTVPIRMMVRQWDTRMADLLLSMRATVDPFDVGHYDQQLIEMRLAHPCRRCGSLLEAYLYGRGEPDDEHRVAYLCCVCGPVSEHRERGLALEVVESTPSGRGGEELVIRAKLHRPDANDPVVGSTAVSLRFFDKARNECVVDVRRTVAAGTSLVDFVLPLPETLSTDQHSIWLAAVSAFDVAYARLRFACLPSPDPPTGGSSAEC